MSELHPLLFWTADRSALVEEGDPRAAFLAYAPSDPIAPEHLDLVEGNAAPDPDPESARPATRKPTPRKPRGS